MITNIIARCICQGDQFNFNRKKITVITVSKSVMNGTTVEVVRELPVFNQEDRRRLPGIL